MLLLNLTLNTIVGFYCRQFNQCRKSPNGVGNDESRQEKCYKNKKSINKKQKNDTIN